MPQTLARHVTEIGKIRIGCQVPIERGKNAGKPRPEKLKHFRLTSNSQTALQMAAQKYGGEVRRWTVRPEWQGTVRAPDHAWELFTTTDRLDILMRPDSLMHTLYEQWEGPYCTLRCDGAYILKDARGKLVGLPCQCPSLPEQRKALALQGQACQEVSRICVMLEGLPLGQWRLDTRGFYAPAEIRGLQDILRGCQVDQLVLPATMRLEHRSDRKMVNGEKLVFNYSCVVIEPRQTIDQLLLEGERRRLALPPAPDERQKSLAEHIEDLTGRPPETAIPSQPQQGTALTGTPPPAQQETPATRSTPTPGPATVASGQSSDVDPTATVELRRQIDQLLQARGWTEQRRTQWRGQHVRKYKARSFAHIAKDTLQALLAELQAEDAAQARAKASAQTTAEPPGGPGQAPARPHNDQATVYADPDELEETTFDWRGGLHELAADTLAMLDGTQGEVLELEVRQTCERAWGICENAEATEDQGRVCVAELRAVGDKLSVQLGLNI
jgi:hypothetical protein